MTYIKTFEAITRQDSGLVGGKGASLAQMYHEGLPVPEGFVITTDAFKDFFGKNIPASAEQEIRQALSDLGCERVAVRSSATAEDSMTASWAGQLDTFLNVTRENVIENVKKCWDSIHSERAKAYADRQKVKDQKVAVIVQKMVASKVSGVIFTVNPVTKNKDEIIIDAIFGLGELLVQGKVTPYNFILDKKTLTIKSMSQGEQDVMLIFKDGETQEILVPEVYKNGELVSTDELRKLAGLALKIESMYKIPQDIEWAKENSSFFIVQARPVTTI